MQPQQAQNMFAPQNVANNTTGNVRSNQPTAGAIHRQTSSSPAPRNRYVQATAMYPPVHQGVVLQQFAPPYATRQPQFQQFQYSHQYFQNSYYPHYVPQAPQHPRSAVNPGVGIGLSTAMIVQPGGSVSGPAAAGNPSQLPIGVPAASSVLNVGNASTAQPVGVPPHVGMPHQPPQQQQQQHIKGKLRSHALQIIHPITNRNILEDLDNENNNASAPRSLPVATTVSVESVDYQGLGSLSVQPFSNQGDTPTILEVSQQKDKEPALNRCIITTNEPLTYNMDISHQTQQTPIVSALSDAPSVEILPTQPQKSRGKKSQNVLSSIQDQNSSQGKSLDDIQQQTDVSTTATTANANCVQEQLPTNYINHQVPEKQEQLTDILEQQEEVKIQSLKSSNDYSSTNQTNIESCAENVGASEQQERQSTVINITKPIETMQLDEKETLTLPQQKQIKTVGNKQEQKQQPQECSNATNKHEAVSTTILASTAEITITDFGNNNNVSKITSLSANTENNKSIDKFDKENENITDKETNSTPSVTPNEIVDVASSTSKTSVHDCNETDLATISPKTDLECSTSDNETTSITASTRETIIASTTQSDESLSTADCINDDDDTTSDTATVTNETTSNESESKSAVENLINYNEGQWSPSNPSGKKQYNREQLMQLRDAKASRKQPEVKNTLIFSQTNLMPAFASRGGVKKIQSMVGAIGGARGNGDGGNYQNNYMKQSSMSGRVGGGGADGGHHNRNSGKPIIHLNLSLNQDVKLNEADNAWRPSVLVKGDDLSDPDFKAREKDELIRRIRGILNKLTPEKFETLVEEIIKLKIDTPEKMEAVMILVFEKAIDEPNFSVSYASLCHRLINEVKARDERMESGTKSNLGQFRNALLDKTEREFTQNVTKSSAKEEKLQPMRENISMCKDVNERIELEALLEEEERKIRRRSGGTVRFIGELFKISILTGKIIHTCIEALLKDPNNEDMLECLCKLLTTVGQKFEQTPIPKSEKAFFSLDSVIQRMQTIASKSENTKISSRVRFMLQDVIDLRKKKWKSTRNEAPKTMEQIEKEANNEQLSNQYLNNMYQVNLMSGSGGSSSGKRDDRAGRNDGRSGNYGGSHSQRGDTGSLKRQQGGGIGSGGSHSQSGNSNNDDNWHTIPSGKGNRSVVVDTSKLVGMTNVDMNIKKMGGASLFQWSNSSTQPTTTLSNSFAVLSLDSNKNTSSDRDRSGPRNKGSYNKGSMERDRYDRGDRMLARTGSSQASRENSSSRGSQGVRGITNLSNMQKSASHSKYTQQMPTPLSRMTGKPAMSSGGSTSGLYREQQPTFFGSKNSHQQFNPPISDSTQPSAAPPAVFEEPTDSDLKLIKAVTNEMVENASNSKIIDNSTISCIKRIKDSQRCGLLYYILTDYLHLSNVGYMYRRHLANCVAFLMENKYISVEHFKLAYKNFADIASDLMVDIPELWLYIFEFTGPLIVKKIITVNDLWNLQLRNSGPPSFSLKFLKTFLQYCTREVGPSFTRNMWKKNHVKWTDFMNENEVAKFIQINKFEYVEDENSQPEIDTRQTNENRIKHVVEHIEQLLKESSSVDNVIDYINGNIIDVDKIFIKSLTSTLASFAIKDSSNYNLDMSCFQKICIPVLLRYLDSKEDLELECLYALQLLVHSLEHPRGLLAAIFGALYDADVIPHETFIAWRSSKDQSAGKGVAVKALNPFFNQVINGETSDDN